MSVFLFYFGISLPLLAWIEGLWLTPPAKRVKK